MATFSKRGNTWQAKVRRKGYPVQTGTFETKAKAEDWARDAESQMRRGTYVSLAEAEHTTLEEALKRYLKEVTPSKKGAKQESNRIRALMEMEMAEYSLANLRSSHIARWRDELVEAGKAPTTIRNMATIISQVYEVARVEWRMEGLHNPVRGVKMPAHRPGRDRRLRHGEENKLLDACREASNPWVTPAVQFALATAMRQGEILSLRWDDIQGNIAKIRETKSARQSHQKKGRDVPLSQRAREILKRTKEIEQDVERLDRRIFPIGQNQLEYHFRQALKRAKIEDLRFHDLRHEATSRLFEQGLSMMEVPAITGHKTLQMLQRYTHFETARLAEKMR